MTRGRTRWGRPGEGYDIHPLISVLSHAPATAHALRQMLVLRRSVSHACRAALISDGRQCRDCDRHRTPGAPVRVSPTGFCPPRSVRARVCDHLVCGVNVLVGERGCGVGRLGDLRVWARQIWATGRRIDGGGVRSFMSLRCNPLCDADMSAMEGAWVRRRAAVEDFGGSVIPSLT